MNSSFFKNIPKITHFVEVIEENNFIHAPLDWFIVIADIRNSTKAVESGQYKDVNMIGGAVICAIQNATGTRDWPFVFGGDGATVLIEPSVKPEVEAALVKTRSLAMEEFGLELRIGFIPVEDVCKQDTQVLVARYETSPGNSFAQFGGGGIELADQWLKSEEYSNTYIVPDYSLTGQPDLSGLSCRWEALKTQKGQIVCMLVKPQADDFQHKQAILSEFLSKLTAIIGLELSNASPVSQKSLRFSWPPQGLSAEAKLTRGSNPYRSRFIELYLKSLIQWILERFNLTAADYNAPVYKEELLNNSDYCKFDDALKLVIDCTKEESASIKNLLSNMQLAKQLEFGYFSTEQALMTCLLFDLKSSQHVHFIDGDNGGLYAASKELKQHLASGK